MLSSSAKTPVNADSVAPNMNSTMSATPEAPTMESNIQVSSEVPVDSVAQ